jgi:hypothetical protein
MCSSTELEEILNFGKVNIYTANTGNHVEQGDPNIYTMVPMSLNLCKICTNMQLGEVVNPHFLYKNFRYKTQITKGLNEHFKALTSELISKLRIKPKDKILDIGSNDGTFLSYFKGVANIIGVEPGKKISDYANQRGINTINAYFNKELAKKIKEKYGAFNLIFCANTIANIDDLHELFDASKFLLAKNGYFIIETQNGADVIDRFLLDTIYHEHLSYFTYPAFKLFLEKKEFRIEHVKHHNQKGGSLQIWFTHKSNLKRLHLEGSDEQKLIDNSKRLKFDKPTLIKRRLEKKIQKIRNSLASLQGEELFGFGASVGSNTLMHLFCNDLSVTEILDDRPVVTSLPYGKKMIPVKQSRDVGNRIKKRKILVFAYRYIENIINNHKNISRSNFVNIFSLDK